MDGYETILDQDDSKIGTRVVPKICAFRFELYVHLQSVSPRQRDVDQRGSMTRSSACLMTSQFHTHGYHVE